MSEGFKLFKGKIADVLRRPGPASTSARSCWRALVSTRGHTAYVEFQNENLTATVDGKILATTPRPSFRWWIRRPIPLLPPDGLQVR